MTDVATSSPRPLLIAVMAALIVSAVAVQRQTARDRLELGNFPSSGIVDGEMAGIDPPRPPTGQELHSTGDERAGATATPPPLTAELEARAMETFTDARGGLLECVRSERASRGAVAGKLPVVVRVVDQGLVANVDLGPSPVRSEAFDECATLTLAQLVFPAGIAPRDVSITYDLR